MFRYTRKRFYHYTERSNTRTSAGGLRGRRRRRRAITTAVPPRPEDGTVSVIALFAIVSGCVTDCNFQYCNGHVREMSP